MVCDIMLAFLLGHGTEHDAASRSGVSLCPLLLPLLFLFLVEFFSFFFSFQLSSTPCSFIRHVCPHLAHDGLPGRRPLLVLARVMENRPRRELPCHRRYPQARAAGTAPVDPLGSDAMTGFLVCLCCAMLCCTIQGDPLSPYLRWRLVG